MYLNLFQTPDKNKLLIENVTIQLYYSSPSK